MRVLPWDAFVAEGADDQGAPGGRETARGECRRDGGMAGDGAPRRGASVAASWIAGARGGRRYEAPTSFPAAGRECRSSACRGRGSPQPQNSRGITFHSPETGGIPDPHGGAVVAPASALRQFLNHEELARLPVGEARPGASAGRTRRELSAVGPLACPPGRRRQAGFPGAGAGAGPIRARPSGGGHGSPLPGEGRATRQGAGERGSGVQVRRRINWWTVSARMPNIRWQRTLAWPRTRTWRPPKSSSAWR